MPSAASTAELFFARRRAKGLSWKVFLTVTSALLAIVLILDRPWRGSASSPDRAANRSLVPTSSTHP